MSGHTPGPWEVRESRYYGNGWMIESSDGYRVAMLPNVSKLPENAANARVIVAAPELLAEVEREYETLADIRNEWPGRYTPQGQAKLCRLRDLIAKATGRTEQDVQDDFGNRAIAEATGEKA